MTLDFRDRRDALQWVPPKSPFLSVNRSSIPYGLRVGAGAMRYCVNIVIRPVWHSSGSDERVEVAFWSLLREIKQFPWFSRPWYSKPWKILFIVVCVPHQVYNSFIIYQDLCENNVKYLLKHMYQSCGVANTARMQFSHGIRMENWRDL